MLAAQCTAGVIRMEAAAAARAAAWAGAVQGGARCAGAHLTLLLYLARLLAAARRQPPLFPYVPEVRQCFDFSIVLNSEATLRTAQLLLTFHIKAASCLASQVVASVLFVC